MSKTISRRLFVAGICCFTSLVQAAEPTHCSVCNNPLPNRYWTMEDQFCCSEMCVNKLRPTCDSCGKRIKGRYLESEDKIYCSETCFNTSLEQCEICREPIHSGFSIGQHHYCEACGKKSSTCFSCGLPAINPTTLEDDRIICNHCLRWSVKEHRIAQMHYERALRHLQAWTGLELSTVPTLELCDKTKMQELAGGIRKTDDSVALRGLYSRQTYLVKRGIFGKWTRDPDKTTETIYIVDRLHDQVFRVAALHELMHDLVHEHFPQLEKAPLWVHEGISQQAAAEYCRRRNYADILEGIESSTDPDYGDGYRYIKNICGYDGWYALKKWMDTVDVETLPKTAPK